MSVDKHNNKNKVVYGIFNSREDVEGAVSRLQEQGFRHSDVSVLFAHSDSAKQFAHEKGTKAPEGTAVGAGSGATIGGVLGWLAGIGAIAIPGIGPFVAAGPILGMLAGAGAGGVVGGIAGGLVGMGIPEYEAKRYEGLVKAGGILLSVHCDDGDWVKRAKKLLEDCHARDISATSEAKAEIEQDPKASFGVPLREPRASVLDSDRRII